MSMDRIGLPIPLVGYVRVSATQGTLDAQVAALKNAGVPDGLIFVDMDNARGIKREGLQAAIAACGAGSVLLIWKFDRLGVNAVDIIRTVNLLRDKGVAFRSISEADVTSEDKAVPAGRLIHTVCAALAGSEDAQITHLRKKGRQAAQDRGALFGRESFAQKYIETGLVSRFQSLMSEGNTTVTDALKTLKIPRSTYLKYRGIFITGVADQGARE